MMLFRPAGRTGLMLAAVLALSGCLAAPEAPGAAAIVGAGASTAIAPPNPRPGGCYAKDVTPAVIEQVREEILVAPAEIGPEGAILTPARFEERLIPRVVDGGEEIQFETPCPPRWTDDFIASLQRALAARGLYQGPVTGTLDEATNEAIRAFQLGRGLNSEILSMENARALGLVEIEIDREG